MMASLLGRADLTLTYLENKMGESVITSAVVHASVYGIAHLAIKNLFKTSIGTYLYGAVTTASFASFFVIKCRNNMPMKVQKIINQYIPSEKGDAKAAKIASRLGFLTTTLAWVGFVTWLHPIFRSASNEYEMELKKVQEKYFEKGLDGFFSFRKGISEQDQMGIMRPIEAAEMTRKLFVLLLVKSFIIPFFSVSTYANVDYSRYSVR